VRDLTMRFGVWKTTTGLNIQCPGWIDRDAQGVHNACTEHKQKVRAMKKRRARRPEGHVYRRGDIWWFKWIGLDGQTVYRSSGSTEREVAEDQLRGELERKSKGLVASPDPRRCRVDDLLEALEARYTTEGRRSLERLRYSRDQLLRLFKDVSAVRVTGAHILRYATLRLEEKAAPATVNRELAALRAAYRLGLENDLITAMPRIKLLPENNVRKGFADAQQVEIICRRLRDHIADAARFAFQTGWRRAETFSLAWSQVDWNGGFVRLEPGTTKTGEGRSFPMTPALRRILERRQEYTRRCERAQARIIPLVFHHKGRPVKSFKRSWAEACKRAGLPGLLFHDLRRSAVRNLERAGVSRSVAMKLTGHKTESVYRRYAIVAESDLREAGAKLNALSDNFGDISGTVREDRHRSS
jgi:integrase